LCDATLMRVGRVQRFMLRCWNAWGLPVKRMQLLLGGAMLFQAMSCLAQQQDVGGMSTAHPVTENVVFGTTPIWQDEFDYSGLPDLAKWNFELGGDGWGNNELQEYVRSLKNARVDNGVLTITARNKRTDKRNYTSARLTSKGKGDFRYGRFEIRAKLPTGRGTWPALWMLPTDKAYGNWPKSGEIDIMEHVGFDPGRVHTTVHTEAYNHRIATQRGRSRMVDDVAQFHVYRMDWTPASLRGYIDDELLFDFPNEGTGSAAWPFDQPFHLMMNIAVGGDWGGKEGVDNTAFPASMEVDYVRVYPLIGE
jgi:beta-glucanase (GH16 family)